MPALSAPATVLVTGGTGYIGSWIVKDLVERGYKLVLAVRNDKAGEDIAAQYPGKTSHVIVTDIVAEGAYDEAVKNVDAVVHVASPVIFTFEDPQDHIGPAVGGALGILKSASKAPNVKRVIITGSAISVNFFADTQPHKYNETEWDVVSPALVKEHGKNVNPWAVYAASKTLAEKAAWDWVKENKPSYDLVYILPSINFGPWAHNVASREKLGSTIGVLFSTFAAGGDSSGAYVAGWVDVRDTAKVHVLALESEEAANERIINNSASFAWQDVYDILNERGFPNIPKGVTGAGKSALKIEFDNAKSLKLFPGLEYRDLATSIGDMGEQINKLGWFIPAESPAVASS